MSTLLGLLAALVGGVGLWRVRDRVPTPKIIPTPGAIREVPLAAPAPQVPNPPPQQPAVPGPVGTGSAPRGIRNNNPGNIKYSPLNAWQGQTGSDGVFATFSSPVYGIRALAKTLLNYQRIYQLNTIRKIISRWSATDQGPYIAFISRVTGIAPDARIDLVPGSELFNRLVTGIIRFENGQQPYSPHQISAAMGML